MRYKDLRFWDKLGKNCRFFFTSKMNKSLHPLAKKLLISLPPRKISTPVDSPQKNFYPFPLHNNSNVMTPQKIYFKLWS